MAKVKAKENENFENTLRRFKRACDNEKIIQEARERQNFEKPSVHRKKEKIIARRRHLKKINEEKEIRNRLY